MALQPRKPRDHNPPQAGGYYSEGDGIGDTIHVREELLIAGLSNPPMALVLRVYADRIVSSVETWKGTNR